MGETIFLCPQCRSSLNSRENKVVCPECASEYEIADGVVKLSALPSYWGLIPSEEMKPFLEEVKNKGWKDAIISSANPKIKEQYLFTDCPSRSDGTFYLSLNSKSKVLDLGSGWGSYTFALSPRVGSVISADTDFESLKFISLRAQQDNYKNIAAVQIDPLDLGKIPFEDDTFDAVIMNGVLEWVGAYLKKGDPLKLQEKCLNEVERILKPQGEVWIGIENRFGLRYLLGEPDDHLKYYTSSKISYTTIVPRLIASLITRIKLGIPYRTYTHSLSGYRRMLKRSGFRSAEFYYPDPDYRAISSKIFPIESKDVKERIGKRIQEHAWLRLFSLLNMEKALCDSYFILAKK